MAGQPVLVIDGMGICDDLATSHLLGKSEYQSSVEQSEIRQLWAQMPLTIVRWSTIDEFTGEAVYATSEVIAHITSGRYRAAVVADLSNDMWLSEFERQLGPVLQCYVQAGGHVAFPTCELLVLVRSGLLSRLFGAEWSGSGYYRTTWGACAENLGSVQQFFPGMEGHTYSAKACSLRGVPLQDRGFGVTSESRHESSSMQMQGLNDASPSGPTEDYDVSVAVHAYGSGAISVYGDVNYEVGTVKLVGAFCASCPVVVDLSELCKLHDDVFVCLLEMKELGNGAFMSGMFANATKHYRAALGIFDGEGFNDVYNKTQLAEKVKILSNMSECHLRLGHNSDAAEAASQALAVDAAHSKSLFRRATARVELAKAASDEFPQEERGRQLMAAKDDIAVLLEQSPSSQLPRKLYQTIQKLVKEMAQRNRRHFQNENEKQRRQFQSGFSAALGAGADVGVVEVTVQTMDSGSFIVTLKERGTVADLKSEIQEAQGTALDEQQLFMLGEGEGAGGGSEVQESLSDDQEIRASCTVLCVLTARTTIEVSNAAELQAASATIASQPSVAYTIKLANGEYNLAQLDIGGTDILLEGVGMKRQSSVKPGEDQSKNSQLNTKLLVTTTKKIVVRGLTITQGVEVAASGCDACFQTVHVTVGRGHNDDAFVLKNCRKAKIEDCEIFGGSDGLMIQDGSCNCHIKDSDIRFADCRGVFANPHFTVEDVEISNCGSYGMKTRMGCTRLGENDIQPGPWDSC